MVTDAKKIRLLDDAIFNLEIAQERATVMADEIDQGYFDLKDDDGKLFYFGKASIEFDILFDYIVRIGEQLADARKMLREWRRAKADDMKEGACSHEMQGI